MHLNASMCLFHVTLKTTFIHQQLIQGFLKLSGENIYLWGREKSSIDAHDDLIYSDIYLFLLIKLFPLCVCPFIIAIPFDYLRDRKYFIHDHHPIANRFRA